MIEIRGTNAQGTASRKIDGIKALRVFCQETFGVTSGLKQSKDFIEYLITELPPLIQPLNIGERYNSVSGTWVVLSFDEVEAKMVNCENGRIEYFGRNFFDPTRKSFDLLKSW